MSKIIKKKFINSLPVLLILSLLGMSAAGLIFNFNIEINKIGDKIGLSFEVPEVEANADVATTTVTVKNAAPYFTSDPQENPASASTTPTNVGDSLNFIATADDQEENNYYLIVCDQDGVTPGALGVAPTCTNKTFCVSGATAPTAQASCYYNVESSIVAETQNWVAYVCDDHSAAGEAACTANSNDGAFHGEAGSPFYVNHAAIFSLVTTTVNNQLPGDDLTFLASTTDTDVLGGADVLSLYVCDTNVWATSTGCGGNELCTGTSTSPDVSCSYTVPIPTADGIANTYYAFVKDWHNMPASGNSKSSTWTAANATPSVSSVLLNNGNPITLNIKGNTTTVYASSTAVTDNNGCADISSSTGTIYWSSATGGANCAADDNDCYPIPVACAISGCTGGVDIDVNVQCTTDLEYYAIPTNGDGTDNNPNWATDWLASIRAFDEAVSYASTSPGVDVVATAAIEVNEVEIAYGSLIAGQNTGTDNATTTIVNAGNSPLDTELIGDDMMRNGTGPEFIPASRQEFDLANFSWGGGTPIASSSNTTVDITAPRPTSATDVEDDIYWGIGVPIIFSGDYSGLNTFSALLDSTAGGEW